LKKLLYAIDDTKSTRKLYQMIFKEEFDVITFRSYESCLLTYGKIFPTVVICDLVLPTMNGWSGIEALLELNPSQKLVIASAMDSQIQKVQAEKMGIPFWNKGGDYKLLQQIVHNLIGADDGA
jgi:DNA-binding NtrC family response regulator